MRRHSQWFAAVLDARKAREDAQREGDTPRESEVQVLTRLLPRFDTALNDHTVPSHPQVAVLLQLPPA